MAAATKMSCISNLITHTFWLQLQKKWHDWITIIIHKTSILFGCSYKNLTQLYDQYYICVWYFHTFWLQLQKNDKREWSLHTTCETSILFGCSYRKLTQLFGLYYVFIWDFHTFWLQLQKSDASLWFSMGVYMWFQRKKGLRSLRSLRPSIIVPDKIKSRKREKLENGTHYVVGMFLCEEWMPKVLCEPHYGNSDLETVVWKWGAPH